MAKNKKYPEAMEYAQSILGMNKYSAQEDIEDTDNWDEDDAGELFKESLSFSAFDKDSQEEIREAVREDIYDIICCEDGVVEEKSRQKVLKWITQNLCFGYDQKLILNEELNNLFDSILKEIMDDLEKENTGDLE